jgi:hypothetical protein
MKKEIFYPMGILSAHGNKEIRWFFEFGIVVGNTQFTRQKAKGRRRNMLGVLTGVKVPPYGGRFSPGRPAPHFLGVLSHRNRALPAAGR